MSLKHKLASILASTTLTLSLAGCTINRNQNGNFDIQQTIAFSNEDQDGEQVQRLRVDYFDPAQHKAPTSTRAGVLVPVPFIEEPTVEVLAYGEANNKGTHRVGAGAYARFHLDDNIKLQFDLVGERRTNRFAGFDTKRYTLADVSASLDFSLLRLQVASLVDKQDGKRESIELRASVVGEYNNFAAGVAGRINLEDESRRVGFAAANLPNSRGEGVGWRFLYYGNFSGETRLQGAIGLFNTTTRESVRVPLGIRAINDSGYMNLHNTVLDPTLPGLLAHTSPDFAVSKTIELRVDYLHNNKTSRIVPQLILYPLDIVKRLGASSIPSFLRGIYVGGGPSFRLGDNGNLDVKEYLRAGYISNFGLNLYVEHDAIDKFTGVQVNLDLFRMYDKLSSND